MTCRYSSVRYSSVWTAAALLLGSSLSLAQPVPAPLAPKVPIQQRVYALPDTVRIAGERLPVEPLRVPAAASLLTPRNWETARSAGIDEALAPVPGVFAQPRSGGQDVRLTIRGFGARGAGERSNAGTTRGIRISLDGFPLTEPDGRTSLDLADAGLMDAVRVVRSNTSGLFGPASGGLVDLYSTSDFPRPFFSARTECGSFGYTRQIADLGVRSGTARIRFTASSGKFDGWRAHSGGSQTTILASVVSEPSPFTTAGVYVAATHNLQRQPGALTLAEYDATPRAADPKSVTQNMRRDNRIGRVAAKLEHRLAGGQSAALGLFVEPKVLHRSERGAYRDFNRVHTGGSALIGLPFSIGSTQLRITAGLDDAYQDGSVLFYNLGPNGTRGVGQKADTREGINNFGVFTEVHVAPSPSWEITAGARGDYVHYIAEDHMNPALDDSRTLRRVSPRAAVSYRLGPDHTIYTALSTGIESPAFNEIDPPAPFDTLTALNPFLDPAYSRTYEIGAKGRLHTAGIGYDLALYTLEVRNDIVPWDGGAYYRTAGKSRRSGVELGLSAGSETGLSGRFALTASRNRYVDYLTGAPDDSGNLVTVRYDDNASAGLPGTVVHATARYRLAAGPYLEGVFHQVSSYFANDANTQRAPAYSIADVTVGASRNLGGRPVGAFVSVRNVADRKYVASVYINGVGGRYLEPGMGRNVLVGVRLGR